MRVAIPVFRDRISPVFDWCHHMIVVEIDAGGAELSREKIGVAGISPFRRPEHLCALGVDVLLCGGISAALAGLVEVRGIRIVPWAAGEVNAVLQAFLQGRLPDPRFMMPGWHRGRGRRRFQRGWRGGRP